MQRKAIVAATIVALALAGVAAWWFNLDDSTSSSPSQHGQVAATRQQMPSSDQQRIETSLSSADRNQQASIMSPELQAAYLAQDQSWLPNGSKVSLQPDTMTVSGNAAQVTASLQTPNGTSTFTLVLARSDTNSPWLLVDTKGK